MSAQRDHLSHGPLAHRALVSRRKAVHGDQRIFQTEYEGENLPVAGPSDRRQIALNINGDRTINQNFASHPNPDFFFKAMPARHEGSSPISGNFRYLARELGASYRLPIARDAIPNVGNCSYFVPPSSGTIQSGVPHASALSERPSAPTVPSGSATLSAVSRLAAACLLSIALSGCGAVKQQLAEDAAAAKAKPGDEFFAKLHAEVSAAGPATFKSWLAQNNRPRGEIYEEQGCVPYSMGVETPEGHWVYSVAVCQEFSDALKVHELDQSVCMAGARNWSDFPENASDETCAWMKAYARGEVTGYYDAPWSITKVYPESKAAKERANYEEARKPSKPLAVAAPSGGQQ